MRTTRWLEPYEQEIWRSFLSATRLLTEALDRELQRDAGLPHAYYEMLVRLSEAPGRTLRMSELADNSLSSRSRLSHAVSRLEEAGWVRREECPTDRRGAYAVLTDDGFAKLEQAAHGHVDAVREHLFDQLTPEQLEALGGISRSLVRHLSGHARAPEDEADHEAAARSR